MTVRQLLSAEELWEMPELPGKRFELADGELVEMPGTGGLHNLIVGLVYELIRPFVLGRRLGQVFTDGTSYLLRRGPDRLRIPDVSFVSWDHLPEDGVPEGYIPVAPDLAVKVVSPNDRADDVHDKVDQRKETLVREYLEAGARMVLVLWPKRRTVTVYEPGVAAHELGPDDDLDGGDVLPGFRVRVDELFNVERARK